MAGATISYRRRGSSPIRRRRRIRSPGFRIRRGASLFLSGALYFPTSDVTFVGHSGMNVQCLQLVGQRLNFRGTANIRNDCPQDGAAQAFRQTVVRLVE